MKSILTTIALVLVGQVLWAQDDPFKINVIPPSPDAAALGAYGNVPVSLYNGRPNVNIPLYTIQGKSLQLPISLSYSSGGIKVQEVSSWVGLGWTLNAGGVITRSLNGLADEGPGGDIRSLYSEYQNIIKYRNGPPLCNISDASRFSTLLEYYQYQKDIVDPENRYIETQPDNYFFNFGNFGGKMFIDGTFSAYEAPYQGFRINMLPSGDFKEINSWTITTPDGTKYTFDKVDLTDLQGQTPNNYIFNSSWYLSRMESFDQLETIEFHYTQKEYQAELNMSTNTSRGRVLASNFNNQCFGTGDYGPTMDGMGRYITEQVLDSIYFTRNGDLVNKVLFNSIEDRRDKVHEQNGDNVYGSRLNEIVIYDRNEIKLKSFDLNQSYFGNHESASAPESTLRLKLEGVQEFGYLNAAAEAESKPPYIFSYDDVVNLPDRLFSNALDHWGYYNGQDANTTLIPSIRNVDGKSENDYEGSDRSPNPLFTSANSLREIKYPTGGKTAFVFESNVSPTNPYVEGGYDEEIAIVQMHVGGENADPINPYYDDDIGVINPHFKVFSFTFPEGATDVTLKASAIAGGCGGSGPPCATSEQLLAAWVFTGDEPIPFDFYENGSSRLILSYFGFDHLINSTVNTTDLTSLLPTSQGSESYTILLMNSMPIVNMSMFFEYLVPIPTYDEYLAGGLRIKKITDLDENGQTIGTRQYHYQNEDSTTSGRLFSEPIYHTVFNRFSPLTDPCNPESCSILKSQASSISSLSSILGSHIGYSRVTETALDLTGEATNGKTVYTYRNTHVPGAAPFAPASNYDDYNGKLLRQQVYNSDHVLLKEISNNYAWNTNVNRPSPQVFGVKVSPDYPIDSKLLCVYVEVNGCQGVEPYPNSVSSDAVAGSNPFENTFDQVLCEPPGHECTTILNFPTFYKDDKYTLTSRWVYLQETVVRDYDQFVATQWIETKTNYYYDDPKHAQLSREVTLNSKGDTIEVQRFYPEDYPGSNSFTSGHKLDPVIESITKVNNQVINAVGYKYTNGTLRDVYVFETEKPADGFLKSSDGIDFSNYEKRLTYTYDGYRNITTHAKEAGVITAYVWGYNNTLPIAQIVRGYKSEISGTPLQPSLHSEVIDALGSTAVAMLSGGSLSDQEIRDKIELLRNHADMQDAQITTYTHIPGVGISSMVDPNGLKIEYVYDELGRLKYTKDHEDNILSQYDYHYGQN